MRAAALALALLLSAGPAPAAARPQPNNSCPEMSRHQGSWSGRQTCKSGKYSIAFVIEEGRQGPTARYSAAGAGGDTGASGSARFSAGPKPGTCLAAVATPLGELRFLVGFLDKGRRVTYRAVSMSLMGADAPLPGNLSGSADLDQALATAQYRFMSSLPMAQDTCGGTLRRRASR